MMFCPKCGAENADGVQLCGSCSWVLTSTSAHGPNPEAKTSGLAIASLVLGILSFFTCFITAIPAIILGIVGLLKINKSSGQLKGMGLAIAGMALPVVAVPIIILMAAIMMPALSRTKGLAQRLVCGTNMKGLGTAMMVYANDYDRKFPTADQWCDLLIEHADVDPRSFRCKPRSSEAFSYGFNENLDGLTTDDVSPDTVVLFEIVGGRNVAGGPELLVTERHWSEGCNILFADGHAAFVETEHLGDLKWMVQ
jgi:prepilin-type processing-associated H-X9-DG protein